MTNAKHVLQRLVVLGSLGLLASEALAVGPAPFIRSAVNSPRRPATDRALDGNFKPVELLAFFQIKQGQKVVVLLPQDGYVARLLSIAVGPKGKVYVVGKPGVTPKLDGVTGSRRYANVEAITASESSLNVPEPVDAVWSVLSYHSLKDQTGSTPVDISSFNKAVYRSLKAGGHYAIVDYSANSGDTNAPAEKHRIDQLTVVNEAAAAGFLKQSEIQALRHPEDPRTSDAGTMVDASDRFAMFLRKPDLTYGGAIHY